MAFSKKFSFRCFEFVSQVAETKTLSRLPQKKVTREASIRRCRCRRCCRRRRCRCCGIVAAVVVVVVVFVVVVVVVRRPQPGRGKVKKSRNLSSSEDELFCPTGFFRSF